MKKTLAQSLHITPAAGPGPAYTINVSHFDKVINISDNLTDTLRAICNRQGVQMSRLSSRHITAAKSTLANAIASAQETGVSYLAVQIDERWI